MSPWANRIAATQVGAGGRATEPSKASHSSVAVPPRFGAPPSAFRNHCRPMSTQSGPKPRGPPEWPLASPCGAPWWPLTSMFRGRRYRNRFIISLTAGPYLTIRCAWSMCLASMRLATRFCTISTVHHRPGATLNPAGGGGGGSEIMAALDPSCRGGALAGARHQDRVSRGGPLRHASTPPPTGSKRRPPEPGGHGGGGMGWPPPQHTHTHTHTLFGRPVRTCPAAI
eukprot:14148502-Alexandrium_andersonii.AAC.2